MRAQDGSIPDVLLLLEHPPIYTRGRRSTPEELPMAAEWYELQGIAVHDTDRGGRVTYHGPGQLVAYPIVDLSAYGDDVHEYVRRLEQVAIEALGDHAVPAQTIKGLTGVWTDPAEGRRDESVSISRRFRPVGGEDRVDWGACEPGGHYAWALGQRQQRFAAVRVGGALRDRGLPGQPR